MISEGLKLSLPVYQSGVLPSALQLALVSFDVIRPHSQMFSQLTCFSFKEEHNFTLIEIPPWPSFIPCENDISLNVISFVLHSAPLAQGGIILPVKWSFGQCRPVCTALRLATEALKGYTSMSCCQLLWSFLLLSAVQTKLLLHFQGAQP